MPADGVEGLRKATVDRLVQLVPELRELAGANRRQREDREDAVSLLGLQEEGKVRHLGVSNFTVGQLERLGSIAAPVSLQPSYSLIDRNVEEPLQLMLVEVDPQQAIGPRAHDHVRHQLRGDGLAQLLDRLQRRPRTQPRTLERVALGDARQQVVEPSQRRHGATPARRGDRKSVV